MIKRKLNDFAASNSSDWKYEFDIMPNPDKSIFFPSEEDWNEMGEALKILNRHTAANREEYIRRFHKNALALRVKLNDLKNNMDISRIPSPTSKDYERLEKYKAEYRTLLDMLPSVDYSTQN